MCDARWYAVMTRSKVKVTTAWKPLKRSRPSVPHATNCCCCWCVESWRSVFHGHDRCRCWERASSWCCDWPRRRNQFTVGPRHSRQPLDNRRSVCVSVCMFNTNIAVRWPKSPLYCYWNSRAIWDHTVLPATWQRWHSSLYPSQSCYSI